ncbi:MAG: hypothetical protein RML56_12805 [Burkholderiales bacterium]|nr:hypothetical protein [Burkholderiales bacterium]MDW8469711.1 hypothetical protein [Burkholderiales bacterium]
MERIERAAAQLTGAFERLLRTHGAQTAARGRTEVVAQERIEEFLRAARLARREYRLGLIGRARVAHRLQQTLLGKGYPAQLVRQVLFAMLVDSFTRK